MKYAKQMKRGLAAFLTVLLSLGAAACQSPDPDPQGTAANTAVQSESASIAEAETVTEPADETESEGEPTETAEAALPPVEFVYRGERFAVADDGRSATVERLSGDGESTYDGAFFESELLDGDFRADLHVKFSNLRSESGLLFCASETDGGLQGYALIVRENTVSLSRVESSAEAGVTVTDVLTRFVSGTQRDHVKGEGFTLRVERIGTAFRLYYLDDAEGVEPWPEMEMELEDADGRGIGYLSNGYGASFGEVLLEPVEEVYEGSTYQNPVCPGADPYILYHEGKYYLYATNLTTAYDVYTSSDLQNWMYEGICAEGLWGLTSNYWAPEVFAYEGKFYMVATVDWHVGIAVADHPLGPFVANDTWLLEGSIDGHIFIDDDGRKYLYVHNADGGKSGISGYELTDDMSAIKEGSFAKLALARGGEAWERYTLEGPYMLKYNGRYYLTYSGSGYEDDGYSVGYSVSDSPLGTFVSYELNPVLTMTPQVHGCGHHSFTVSPDGSEMLIVYHKHYDLNTVHPRQTCIDRVRFSTTAFGEDRLEIFGPTYLPQPVPSSDK